MGGTAYIVRGDLSPRRLQPVPIPKNLMDRLLRRQRYARPVTHKLGSGSITEVPCAELKAVPEQFLHYLTARFPQPSSCDETILSYLKMGVMRTHVRISEGIYSNADGSHVQFGFSGCAGMAEVSSMLAWHWFDCWYSQNASAIAEKILVPFGFTPISIATPDDVQLFLPLADLGYALFDPEAAGESREAFDLDESVKEQGNAERIIDYLNEHYAALFADGKCRCSFCEPGFRPVRITL